MKHKDKLAAYNAAMSYHKYLKKLVELNGNLLTPFFRAEIKDIPQNEIINIYRQFNIPEIPDHLDGENQFREFGQWERNFFS